jgi:hybrid polyketide synthase/nonribosomal peptide synthetase ACE1
MGDGTLIKIAWQLNERESDGGEPLLSIVTVKFRALYLPQLHFFNSYGPTEITISSTKMEVDYHQDLSRERFPAATCCPTTWLTS